MCPQYLWIDTPHAYGRTTLKFRFLMGIFKFSDPPYGGSNEVFGKNQNFRLVLNIKLHLKMSVNYQLQISPPPNLILTGIQALYYMGGKSMKYVFLETISGKSEGQK